MKSLVAALLQIVGGVLLVLWAYWTPATQLISPLIGGFLFGYGLFQFLEAWSEL